MEKYEGFKMVRRTRNTTPNHQQPTMGLRLPQGEFNFYVSAVELIIGSSKRDHALMFFVNESSKRVSFDLEEPDSDNYHLKAITSRGYSRFSSKSLATMIANIFKLKPNKTHYFLVKKNTCLGSDEPHFSIEPIK